ncbi:MAG: (Fe-S)-binding protein [Acidimicrobiia bacterium]
MADTSRHHVPTLERAGILDVSHDELVACVGCGLCLPYCPTYRVTGYEVASPRGRIAAMRGVELGGAPVSGAFRDAMELCVQCRACEAACPSSVPFGHLMEAARVAIAERPAPIGRAPSRALRRLVEWIAYVVVLPRHAVLLRLTWVLWAAQRTRAVPLRFGIPRLRRASLRAPLVPDVDPSVSLFTGCVMDAWQRDVHRDAMRVMRATGARVGVAGRGADCCGALHLHAGRVEDARRLARRVIGAMPRDGAVVVDSAGCGAAMKDYGHLLGTPDAAAFAARVRDFSEWIAEQPVDPPVMHTGTVVVVQDPCHLRHVQRAHGAVRDVLAPAYGCVDTADDGLCCGAGGAYAALHADMAGAIRDRKVAAIRAVAPRGEPLIVASANPGCAMHLGAAGLTVRHPAELLAAALVPDAERRGTTDG